MNELSDKEIEYNKKVCEDVIRDYDRLYKMFSKKIEDEKHSPYKTFSFTKTIEALYNTINPVSREEIIETSGCKKEYISRMIKILKEEKLIEPDKKYGYRYGYIKSHRFMVFIAILKEKNKDIFPNIKNLKVNTKGELVKNDN